ncbi:tRNA-guanine transglycosylase DpdA, partial [Candidatus Riflebacteria bacterium]
MVVPKNANVSRMMSKNKNKPLKTNISNSKKEFKSSENCPEELRLGPKEKYTLPERKLTSYKKRKKAKMLYFIPDWDDLVDPRYDFVNDYHYSELFGIKHDSHRDDYYSHELMERYNYDGILVSKVIIEESKIKKARIESMGIHKYLRVPKKMPVMGDCGAFGYIAEEIPPYKTSEIVEYYEQLDFDYGVTIDHLIVPGICRKEFCYRERPEGGYEEIEVTEYDKLKNEPNFREVKSPTKQRLLTDLRLTIYKENKFNVNEAQRRWNITLNNGKDFIKTWKKSHYKFQPVAACQGWNPESYTEMFKEYQKMGYDFIALGSLVRSPTSEVLKVLESIAPIRKKDTRIHLFGIARLDAVPEFMKLGVYSCDSASHLRRAWLGSSSNYWLTANKTYAAIRIPPVRGHNARIKKMIKEERGTEEEFLTMENNARQALWDFDKGKFSLKETLDKVLEYDQRIGDKRDAHEKLYRTLLTDKPWKKCPCPLCRELGIEVL